MGRNQTSVRVYLEPSGVDLWSHSYDSRLPLERGAVRQLEQQVQQVVQEVAEQQQELAQGWLQ